MNPPEQIELGLETNFQDRTLNPECVDAQNSRESLPFPSESRVETGKLSDEENAAIREKALEVLRKEFPRKMVDGGGLKLEGNQAELIPARMLNEFVFCQRLFFYEFVEGVFVESTDTVRGSALHRKVDSGKGELTAAVKKPSVSDAGDQVAKQADDATETIHSRSVQMGSQRLGVTAKMDLVEVKGNEVCPVDYKAGAPRVGKHGETDALQLWDTDRMQLGVQALILRDNGYECNEGVIYYRETKQRVKLEITADLETWILQKIAEARSVAKGQLPAPLIDSPKCIGCSLAPVCLPDETRLLAAKAVEHPIPKDAALTGPRRLMAARDDGRPLYLNTQGFRVGCKDEVLQVKDKDKLVDEFRIRDLEHVALFGNIQISTQALQTLCDCEVPITYFSMGGWFYGITRGHTLKNVFLRIEQFRLAREPKTCLDLARKFVNGKIRNQRTMLMRNHVEPPPPTLLRLKRAADDALEAASIDELLGIEGAAASLYFQAFDGMIKVGETAGAPGENSTVNESDRFQFNFERRNRRPPTDPVNALLSLAYSLLSKDCMLAALAVGFDPYVGFYHQPRFGRPALGLDIMEEFRPLVAESAVLSCINNRVITNKDFVRAGETVNLTKEGRKKFFQCYEQRMSSLLTHPLFDYKVSYRRALELQTRILAKCLAGEILEYVPLTTR